MKTPKKYSNLKIVWHKGKINSFLEDKVTSPINVRLKPTNKCNHNCFFCIYHPDYSEMHETTNKSDEIPREKMMEILDNLKDMNVKSVILSGGGEPLIYPHIRDVLSKILENKMGLAMLTNGQKLEGRVAELLSKADWVRVSLDYCTPEMLKGSRGGTPEMFYKLQDNLKRFSEMGGNLGINCIIHNKNNDSIYELAKFCKELGAKDIRFSPVWNPNFAEYHKDSKEKVLEQIEKTRELTGNGFEVYESFTSEFASGGFSQRDYKRCYWMQVIPVIAADCNVYACHNKAYDKSGLIGSINQQSFKDLWFSEKTARIFKSFNPSEVCKHQCSSEDRNKTISELLNCFETSKFP